MELMELLVPVNFSCEQCGEGITKETYHYNMGVCEECWRENHSNEPWDVRFVLWRGKTIVLIRYQKGEGHTYRGEAVHDYHIVLGG